MLTNYQQQAVEATEGLVRVVAGAGSGKTRVLAHRYAFMVNELGISPANILCLTFTNKAAQEMKRRIATMVDKGSVNDFICTIHSFCAKLLRREIYRLGYPKSFLILDQEDARTLARQAMQEWGIDRKKTTAERFLSQISAFKGKDPDAYIHAWLLPGAPATAPDAMVRYMQLQRKHYSLDYDDLVYFSLHILTHYPDAREYWTKKLNYVMIDEVQDLCGDDWKLLDILQSYHRNLFVVGDPDQAIYEWRGGNPAIFVNFKPQTDIILNQNFRSTPDILDVANSIIANNRNRIPKELFTTRLNERRVVYSHFRSEKEEAADIAARIRDEVKKGRDYRNFAVLYRSSFLSRTIEQALMKEKIPYTVWGGVRFFERKEVKDIISFLRLVASDDDDLAFSRVANLPPRGFGAKTMEALRMNAEAAGLHLFPALCRLADVKPFDKPKIRAFVDLVMQARELSRSLPVSELTDWLLTNSGLSDLYRTDEMEERLENVTELLAAMREFELTRYDDDDARLTDYLQEISLYSNPDSARDTSHVRLMTIHQSKGLEFPVVFVIGLTEGVFPNHRSIRERRKDGEEEERRLMYVACTRACDLLCLSESEGYLNESAALKYPSRFLTEIDTALLEVHGNPDPALLSGTRNMVDMLNAGLFMPAEDVWPAGTKVSHRAFGPGVITAYDAAAKSYTVKFSSCERQLLPKFLTKD